MDLGLAEAESMHQAAHVILVIADSEAPFDGLGQARGGPAVVRKTESRSAIRMDANDFGLLILSEPAGASGGAATPQTFDAFVIQGALPA
jgi:hypothetical protein